MVTTMMHEPGLPRSFWTHALQTAVYAKNQVFCSFLPTFDDAPSKTPSRTPSSKMASEDQQAWQDMLENSSLPDYELALVETQEGEDKVSAEAHEHEDCDHEGDL
ncbi:hypothetical protein GN958_ATG07189 [Phytophthora infestans]|uniref:Uncharacterized protein n=1 Tax=Phytophthora infestans TaxID=4787 RepID=A0A8S9UJ16_PHYIN|nr:hypothetical protein GN958_ATG12442 [Phytophthora infestans]KAF4138365.1 hypothetical protein GN958_ATG12445 [Phytophthora infestans]KAF4140506.1 hypothetical protein GN958_ATG10302 [Phytophthora infestans]KAF4143620.1 hypothetical protein GN958_ATG07189 [Phytophthora infestans]